MTAFESDKETDEFDASLERGWQDSGNARFRRILQELCEFIEAGGPMSEVDKQRLLAAVYRQPDPAAVAMGRSGGNSTAKRGPEYFRQIAAMRKTRAGGRPRKQEQSQ
jgi:hypothetical protein